MIIKTRPFVSIIIPVFREEKTIAGLCEHLFSVTCKKNTEIIISDGDLAGGTLKAIPSGLKKEVITVISPKGRAAQMNRGAALASGAVLLFLQADTRLCAECMDAVIEAFRTGRADAGAFSLGIDSPRPSYRIIEKAVALRTRLTRIPYGDQAIFVKASLFKKIGGFPEIPLMEDIALMQRLKKAGARIKILGQRVSTSPRRWETEGIFYTSIRNIIISSGYYAGISPEILRRFYPDIPG